MYTHLHPFRQTIHISETDLRLPTFFSLYVWFIFNLNFPHILALGLSHLFFIFHRLHYLVVKRNVKSTIIGKYCQRLSKCFAGFKHFSHEFMWLLLPETVWHHWYYFPILQLKAQGHTANKELNQKVSPVPLTPRLSTPNSLSPEELTSIIPGKSRHLLLKMT